MTENAGLFVYWLRDREVERCSSYEEWVEWFGTADRRVAITAFEEDLVCVSTVFLGIDRGFAGRPLFFETKVFGPVEVALPETRLYGTWAEAAAGHTEVVAEVETTIRAR